jgi:hypothetical protein
MGQLVQLQTKASLVRLGHGHNADAPPGAENAGAFTQDLRDLRRVEKFQRETQKNSIQRPALERTMQTIALHKADPVVQTRFPDSPSGLAKHSPRKIKAVNPASAADGSCHGHQTVSSAASDLEDGFAAFQGQLVQAAAQESLFPGAGQQIVPPAHPVIAGSGLRPGAENAADPLPAIGYPSLLFQGSASFRRPTNRSSRNSRSFQT